MIPTIKYLLPFLNCFVLIILLEDKMIFNGVYTWICDNYLVRLPAWGLKILGGCILCTATWMGITEVVLLNIHYSDWNIIVDICILGYNAVVTNILYKLST